MKAILLAAGVMMAAGQAGAYRSFTSVDELQSMCRNDYTSALSYVSGVIDAAELAADASKSINLICSPPDATLGTLTEVSCSWVLSGGIDRRASAANQILTSIMRAWPCR